MVPVGLSQSATFLVGKYLGKNRPDLAKKIAAQIRLVTFIWSLSSAILVYFLIEPIMNIYTDSEPVLDVMRKAWWVLCIFVFFDCMQGVINGIVSGLGIVKKVKFATLVSYWVYGIPLSYYCMFKLDMGIEGLWFGPSLAVALNYAVYEYAIGKADWYEVAEQNLKKNKQQADSMSPTKPVDK
tara:strand:+ start:595 stop:1143 length:549 start_codon:yes stop_codon:yes gene_type:complete